MCGIEGIVNLPDGRWLAFQRIDSAKDKKNQKAAVVIWTNWDKDGVPILVNDLDEQKQAKEVFPEISDNYIHSAFVIDNELYLTHSIGASNSYPYELYSLKVPGKITHSASKDMMDEPSRFKFVKQMKDKNPDLSFFRVNYAEYIDGEGDYKRLLMGLWFKDFSKQRKTKVDSDYYNDVRHTVSNKGVLIWDTAPTYGLELTPEGTFALGGLPTALKWFPQKSNRTFDHFLVGYYYFWGYYDIPRDRKNKIAIEPNRFHRLSNSLVGCPQVWCVESDVDGAAKAGSHYILFRNFHVFYFQKFARETYVTAGTKITDIWPKITGGYIDAVANYNGKLLIFKSGFYYVCDEMKKASDRKLNCKDSKSIASTFSEVSRVEAAMVTSDNKLHLFFVDDKRDNGEGANMYVTFDTKYNKVAGPKFTWSKWQFLPKDIDAILSEGKDHYFFRLSYHYKITEKLKPNEDPTLTMGNFFRCGDRAYDMLPMANGFAQYQEYMKQFKPQRAKQPSGVVPAEKDYVDDEKKGFQWWWLLLILLLLLLLLLLLWCCLRRRNKGKFTFCPA